jgi:hypothetical protein
MPHPAHATQPQQFSCPAKLGDRARGWTGRMRALRERSRLLRYRPPLRRRRRLETRGGAMNNLGSIETETETSRRSTSHLAFMASAFVLVSGGGCGI